VNENKTLSFIVRHSKIEGRFDPIFYQPKFMEIVDKIKKTSWTVKELNDIVLFSNKKVNPKKNPNEYFNYVEITDIDVNLGEITSFKKLLGKEAPSRARMVIKKGNIILSTTRPYRGAIAIVPDHLDNSICSTGFAVIEPRGIDRYFLHSFLRSKFSLLQLEQRMTGSNYPAITIEELKKIKIPVPPSEIQSKVAQIVQDAYTQKKRKYKETEELLNSINDYILEKLGIEIPRVEDKRSFEVNYETLNKRYDVFYYQPKYVRIEESFKKGKYELKELKEVARFSKETMNPAEEPEKIFRYIEIANVDSKFGRIDSVKEILGKDAPSRARKVLRAGDVVVSTLRETLKSIAIVPKELDGSIGTTGFAVLRPAINREFLYAILRTDPIQELMWRRATGAIMPAISENDLKSIKLPIPPISIQNEIAEEVKKCREKVERLRKEAEDIVKQAKEKVEKIILGDEEVNLKTTL
jgi:restriction endonuclease S subunit